MYEKMSGILMKEEVSWEAYLYTVMLLDSEHSSMEFVVDRRLHGTKPPRANQSDMITRKLGVLRFKNWLADSSTIIFNHPG